MVRLATAAKVEAPQNIEEKRDEKSQAFSFTTAADQEDRDPVQWTLEGSESGVSALQMSGRHTKGY